jgi:hypothetical protein
MFVFGLVAVAFAAYGMATVDKSVTDGAFNVLTSISSYANRAFDALDGLLDTVDGTSDMCAGVYRGVASAQSAACQCLGSRQQPDVTRLSVRVLPLAALLCVVRARPRRSITKLQEVVTLDIEVDRIVTNLTVCTQAAGAGGAMHHARRVPPARCHRRLAMRCHVVHPGPAPLCHARASARRPSAASWTTRPRPRRCWAA